MKAIAKSTSLLLGGWYCMANAALAQPATQAPAAQPPPVTAKKVTEAKKPVPAAVVKPVAVAPAPSGPVPEGAAAASPAAAPAPVAPMAPAAPAGTAATTMPSPNALPAAPPFPVSETEASRSRPMLGVAPGQQFLVPRVIAVEPPEPAEPPRPPKVNYPIGLELNIMPVWQTSAGYDLFSSNDISTRVGVAADVDLFDVADKTPLSVEAGWSTESQTQLSLASQLEAKMAANNVHGGLKLRYQLLPFLAPHLHMAVGATSLKATYAIKGGTNQQFESQEWLAFGFVGAGVTATIPAPLVVRPGVTLEGGYLVSESMPLRFEPGNSGQLIPASGANLGTLARSGPYMRIGLFLRY